MDILIQILPNFSEIFRIGFLFILKGGWILFVIGFIYILWRLYIIEIQHQFIQKQNWIFLTVKVPKQNLTSTLAVEQIFSQLHALHRSLTVLQKYVEGITQLTYSLEIVSLGGKISFVLRVPKDFQNTVEAAFYAQYPEAEISVSSDYLANFNFVAENDNDLEVLGTEFKLGQDQVIPIKTYTDFEHPSAEEKIIDPLSNLIESLAKIKPYDFIGIQLLIQPLADNDWKPEGERKIKELTGEEIPHKASLLSFLLAPFEWFAKFSYSETFFGHHHAAESENKPRNNWMSMTEAEKDRVSRIEHKIGKPGYKSKLRFLYISPKDKVDKFNRALIVGAFRPFGSIMTNQLKPDSKTWVGVDPVISYTLEAPFLDWKLRWLKNRHFTGYKKRDMHIGTSPFILNTEEIATLYHFPITTETTTAPSSVEKTESKKSQPPVNLPVAEEGYDS